MAYKGKITNADTAGKGVVGLPDTPNMTVIDLQRKFEELETDVIIPKHNEFIADLEEHYDTDKVCAGGATSSANGGFAFGKGVTASENQFVHGQYNAEGDYLHAVGNGTSDARRSNAYTLDKEGNAKFSGEVKDGNGNKLSSMKETKNLAALSYQTMGYYKKNLYDNIGNFVGGKIGNVILESYLGDTFNITGTISAQEQVIFQQKPFTLEKGRYILSKKTSMIAPVEMVIVNSAGELLSGVFEIEKDIDTVHLRIVVTPPATGSTNISVVGQAIMVRREGIVDSTYESYVEDIDTRIKNLPFTEVKGNAETEYRTGKVNLTPANVGALAENATAKASFALKRQSLNEPDLNKVFPSNGILYYCSNEFVQYQNTGFSSNKEFELMVYPVPTGCYQEMYVDGTYRRRFYDAYNNQWMDWFVVSSANGKVEKAKNADADANGNNIASTYATKEELKQASLVDITTTTLRELADSYAGGIRIISMDGESQQKQYSGKNLYDEVTNNVEVNHSGIKFTKNEYGNLTLSGTTTASINAVMNPFTLPAGTYYYQKGTTKNVSVRLYNRTTSAFIAYDNGSFTLAEESTLDVRVQSNSGSAISGTIKIQIEKGSTMTEYEPYVGGIASPNPNYPQSIDSVEVSEVWTHGKNWFNINGEVNTDFNGNIVQRNTVKDGVLTSNTNRASSNGSGQMIATTIGKTYIASATIVSLGTGNTATLMITKKGVNYVEWKDGTKVGSRISVYYTAESTDTLLEFATRNGTGAQFKDIQFEEVADGITTPTPYEPYTETKETLSAQIVLRRNDLLCKVNNVFGVLTKRYRYIINGSENWVKNDPNDASNYLYYAYASIPYADAESDLLCDKMIATESAPVWKNGISMPQKNSLIYLNLGKDIMTTNTAEFLKSYLASNNFAIEYTLATPIFEPLPLADQIALHKLETFGGMTYLFTDSTIEPIIEVEYGTSKVGGYAIKGLNNGEISLLELEQLKTLANELATQIVAGSEA